MAAPNTISEVSAAMKQLLSDANEAAMFLEGRPGLGLIGKNEGFGGAQSNADDLSRGMPVVVHIGRTGGVSPTFSSAQAVATAREKSQKAFQISGIDEYSLVQVPGKTLDYARSASMAWDMLVSSLSAKAMDDAEENLADVLETSIYRDGSGVLARIASTSENPDGDATANELTLAEPDAAMLFELGEYVESVDDIVSNANFGADKTDSTCVVLAIDVAANTIIVDDVDTDANEDYVANDGVRRHGCAPSSSTEATRICLSGIQSWCPTTTPAASDSYFGVDRSVSSRLFGKYMDHSTKSREQALIRGANTLAKEGGSPSLGLIGLTAFRGLVEELGLRKQDVDMNPVTERGLVANVAYKGVWVHGTGGPIRIMPAPKQVGDEVALISPQDWTLWSAGPMLSLVDYDGLSVMRIYNEDAYEGRMVFRGQLVCKRPGRQGRIKLAASS